ncbi:8-amino-7-oxononanoate synthase, partial [Candidatus Bathyarchaeota archaeon]|nr:8-amino-7-oxononanoate synthase [Candidatus Bathyarchaeota archaeon]
MRDPTGFLEKEYNELVEKALDWRLKEVQGPSEPVSVVDGREVIILCANNYLGLTTHPKLKQAALDAVKKYGVGSGA